MLCFDATVKVLRNCNEQRSINDYKFDVYKVRAGLVEMYAFFDVDLDLKPGDIVKSSQVYLTNYDKSPHPTELALRFGKIMTIDCSKSGKASFNSKEPFVIKVNGLCKKPKKKTLGYVGVEKRPFIAVTLCVKNEEGEMFDVLLVALDKKAESLFSLKQAKFIDCKAKLLRKSPDDVFKLVLVEYSTC